MHYLTYAAYSVDPDHTAPRWAIWSASTMLETDILKEPADDI